MSPNLRAACAKLAGRGELLVGDRIYPFGADSTIVIPASVPHQIVNVGDETLEIVAALLVPSVDVRHVDRQAIPLPWNQ